MQITAYCLKIELFHLAHCIGNMFYSSEAPLISQISIIGSNFMKNRLLLKKLIFQFFLKYQEKQNMSDGLGEKEGYQVVTCKAYLLL